MPDRASGAREVLSISTPLVSIGLPTHNGEGYLREAVNSLLAQDYPNLEILIADNASTDNTLAIAREYAYQDPRVRVISRPLNIGAPGNFNAVFHETTGTYFMWAADDDRWEPRYVSACVNALQSNPEAVLACTRINFINEAGDAFIGSATYDNPDLRFASVFKRIRVLLSRGGWYQIYGLIARDVLANTRMAGRIYGTDVVLLTELALQGQFVLVPEVLFHYRLFEDRSELDRGGWHHGIDDRERVKLAPYTFLQEGISEAISISSLDRLDKARARCGMVFALFIDRSPLRAWIAREALARLRLALRERNPRAAIKYAIVGIAGALYRVLGRLRRSF